mmetsp:Transcript_25278/g.69639  ORF Transcript_25278/g.69639 Transcript_25278/m.69639 type:complete len:233 (+) Transcript_25278:70-768(+)|eukprot:scaffold20941_cov34-Tisochrysis_lutea.AAC.4
MAGGGGGSGGEGKKIGVWGMVVVGFFWVHGGIYGNEAMLMAGPPLYVFIMLGIVPFVYSLPIALIVAELSTAFPEDGGYVVWVREACGQVLGSHHAYWVWVIYVVDAAIYPVLVSNYVNTMVPMSETSQGMLSVSIVVFVTVRRTFAGCVAPARVSLLLLYPRSLKCDVFGCCALPTRPIMCLSDNRPGDKFARNRRYGQVQHTACFRLPGPNSCVRVYGHAKAGAQALLSL